MRLLFYILGIAFVLSTTSCATRVSVRPNQTKVITVAPKNHKVVIIKGKRYYYWNGKHYKKTTRGFVMVRV
ncbi:MAG: hypothetical protein HKO90_08745 [Flavobacteriaceae bacterium]|nr:hypothetical protein [Bacteroidia bacterium]NNK88356.1 hypothetical protein [Flavobacteriaceae bacterium]